MTQYYAQTETFNGAYAGLIQSAGKEETVMNHEIHEKGDGMASQSSRSDDARVAVGFSPRSAVARTRVLACKNLRGA